MLSEAKNKDVQIYIGTNKKGLCDLRGESEQEWKVDCLNYHKNHVADLCLSNKIPKISKL